MRQLSNLAFSFHVDGVIWKTSLDKQSGQLALEIRDQEQLHISYRILDIAQNTLRGPIAVDGADWWSTLQLLQSGYLFLEKYQDPQNPLDKSLIVAKSDTGEVFSHFSGHQLVDIREDSIIYQKIEDPSSVLQKPLPDIPQKKEQYMFMEPVVYWEGSDNFEVVKAFLSGENIISLVDYMETGDYIIISYSIPDGKDFIRKMVVIREEEEIYRTILDQKMEGIAPGSFFVFNNYLIFIVEKKQINAIEL